MHQTGLVPTPNLAPVSPVRALIFDFDGLILDTELPEFQAWQEIFEAHGATLALDVWAQVIGSADHGWDPYAHLEFLAGSEVDRPAIRSARRARLSELIADQRALPGVEEYVRDARRLGLRCGIASSSPRDWVVRHLRQTRLSGEFDAITASDDVTRTKPDPELYRTSLRALGVGPDQAIAFEDSPHGVAAAKAAGLFCVAVPNAMTRTLELGAADRRLDSLAQVSLESLLRTVP